MEKELYNSLVLDTYIRLIKVKYPEILVEDLMEYAGIEKYEIGDPTVWFTQTQVNRFHEKLGTITDNLKVAREAGRFAAEPNSLGELRGMIVSLGGICNAFRFMGRYARRLNRSASYITRKISRNQMEVTVTPFEGVTEQKFQCENRQGNFKGIADLFAHKEITISHPECLFEGGKQCRYIISWKESALSHVSRVKKILGVLSLIMAILWFPTLGSLVPTATVIGVLILFLVLGWLTEKAKLSKIIASLNQVYDTKEELLKQIDINSENAQVIIDIGQALRLGGPDASTIDRVAQITGQRLKYDRVMIMIANEERTQLLYHGGSGFIRQEKSYLRHYRISLEQPSEGVFVEAFIRAEPILVNDMEKLREKSTPRSFRPAEFMKPLAFIVCPVTYDETVVGIIVAGNIQTPKKMGRNDKNLMMGVAQQIGSAFHKQKIEAEYEAINRHLVQVQKTEALGVLASGIAHDFNNILMGIQGYASLVRSGFDRDSDVFKRLASIDEYVNNGAEMARQLLGFAQKNYHESYPLNINYLLKMSAKMFGRTKKDILIEQDLEKQLWSTVVDEGQIKQVLMNLYVNAWQAMPRGGKIKVSSRNIRIGDRQKDALGLAKSGTYVMVCVADTGVGMDKATMARIFDPFFTTKSRGQGTGLGLATAYGIVKSHKGAFKVESTPGEGTAFMFFLPASKSRVKTCTLDQNCNEILISGKGKILLIDDEKGVIEVCSEMLETLGYQVFPAQSGKEAIRLFTEHGSEIDLVILDMVMPEMSGMQTLKAIRNLRADVKVLVCSGYSREDEIRQMVDKGCDDYLLKPFDVAMLSEKLQSVFFKAQPSKVKV